MLKNLFQSIRATASILTCLGIAVPSVSAATFIQFNSQPGDYIGGGISQTLTPIDGYITSSRNFDNGVSIHFDGDTWWDMDFAASGNATLVPGLYQGATRFPFQAITKPGLNVSGDGRGCNTLTGEFNVLEAVYGTDGSVERFAADFEQHCESAETALFGQVRFNKDDSRASAEEIKQNIQLAPSDLEKLMEFSDKITEFPTALYFFSQPGDYIGQSIERIFTPTDVDFKASRNFDKGVSFSLNNFGRSDPNNSIWWYLDFASPEILPLVPGSYGLGYRFPFQSPTHPGLSVSGDGRGCNTLSGQFVVLDAAYKASGEVERFDAIFKQNCERTMPPLYGRIRYNAAVNPQPVGSVPEPAMVLGMLSIGGWILTQRRRSNPYSS